MNNLKPMNPYFTIQTPEEYQQLSIALSYARQKLRDQINETKISNYRAIKESVVEQMVKREALLKIKELDNQKVITKTTYGYLFNAPEQDQQEVMTDLGEINGVGGLDVVSGIGDEEKKTDNDTFGGVEDTTMNEDIDNFYNDIIGKTDAELEQMLEEEPNIIKNITTKELIDRNTVVIGVIDKYGGEVDENIMNFFNAMNLINQNELNRRQNEDQPNIDLDEDLEEKPAEEEKPAGETKKVKVSKKPKFKTTRKATPPTTPIPAEEPKNTSYADAVGKPKNKRAPKGSVIRENQIEDGKYIVSSSADEALQPIYTEFYGLTDKEFNYMITKNFKKEIAKIKSKQDADKLIEAIGTIRKKFNDKLGTIQKTDVNKHTEKLDRKITNIKAKLGKLGITGEGHNNLSNKKMIKMKKNMTGYGVYMKPTQKYKLMLGSALAGNNNRDLLKTINM